MLLSKSPFLCYGVLSIMIRTASNYKLPLYNRATAEEYVARSSIDIFVWEKRRDQILTEFITTIVICIVKCLFDYFSALLSKSPQMQICHNSEEFNYSNRNCDLNLTILLQRWKNWNHLGHYKPIALNIWRWIRCDKSFWYWCI